MDSVTNLKMWDARRERYFTQNDSSLRDFVRFSKWFAAETEDLEQRVSARFNTEGALTANVLNLVTRVGLSELFFRNPQFQVSPATVFPDPIFTPSLARVETALLNHQAATGGLFDEGRRCLVDGLLGPRMIMKVGYSNDIATDLDLVMREREHAQREDQAFVMGTGRPRVLPDDLHSVHHEQHRRTIKLAKEGVLPLTAQQLKALEEHDALHTEVELRCGERQMETIRYEHVFNKRVNPLRYFDDEQADSWAERAWMGSAFVRDIGAVQADHRYRASVRAKTTPTDLSAVKDITGMFDREADGKHSDAEPDEWKPVVLYEIVDLRANKVITYANGAEEPLRVVEYKHSKLLPAGPYIDACFMKSPLTDRGIAPPKIYQPHQEALTALETLIMITAKRAVPKLGIVGGAIDENELEEMKDGVPSGIINFKNLTGSQKLSDVMQDVPTPRPDTFHFAAGDRQLRFVERLTGFGGVKLGNQDQAKTATASDLQDEARSGLSEDNGAIMDRFFERIGKAELRLIRKMIRLDAVGEICGEEAMKYWPKNWSDMDIVNDRGVKVRPGSSRRSNSAVEQKGLTDLFAVMSKDPTMPAEVTVEVLERLSDTLGITGINWESVKKQKTLLQLAQLGISESSGGASAPGQGGEGGNAAVTDRAERRSGQPGSEPTRGNVNQATQNVGGGRVPTGASAGDRSGY